MTTTSSALQNPLTLMISHLSLAQSMHSPLQSGHMINQDAGG